jgi:hypothetical protein
VAEQRRQCQGTTKAGTPCRVAALPGGDWCLFHAPDRAAERDAARRRGGRTRSKAAAVLPADAPDPDIRDVAGVVALLAESIAQVRKGTIDPKVANATGYLASVLLRALQDGELERRLAELERRAQEHQERVQRYGP